MTSIGALWIGNVLIRRVVLDSTLLGEMKLPQGFEPRSLGDRLKDWSRAALLCTVIHNRNPCVNRVDKCRTRALRPPVMRDDIDVHVAEFIGGAHQLHLLVPREVAKIKELKLAKGNFDT